MEPLLNSHLNENCKIYMPEGLEELMYDISREVIRASPSNVYQYIADYLAALLVARENLWVASRLNEDICTSGCQPELKDELHEIGLSDDDATKANEIIEMYFHGDKHNETNLLNKLIKKTSINEVQLPLIQEAVKRAFLKHQANLKVIYETSESDEDEVKAAVRHTLQLYRDTKSTDQEYNQKAAKIQAAYKAYDIRRNICNIDTSSTSSSTSLTADATTNTEKPSCVQNSVEVPTEEIFVSSKDKHGISIASSCSLAGSYINLPKYKPYNVHSTENIVFESELENAVIDYSTETPLIVPPTNNTVNKDANDATVHITNVTTVPNHDDFDDNDAKRKRTISFNDVSCEIEELNCYESSAESIEEVLENELDYDFEVEECL